MGKPLVSRQNLSSLFMLTDYSLIALYFSSLIVSINYSLNLLYHYSLIVPEVILGVGSGSQI